MGQSYISSRIGRWDEGEEEAVGCLVLGRSLLFRLEDRAKLRAWQLLKVSIARECQATKQFSEKGNQTSFLKQYE